MTANMVDDTDAASFRFVRNPSKLERGIRLSQLLITTLPTILQRNIHLAEVRRVRTFLREFS